MSKLIIDSFLYDVGALHASADAFAEDVISRTINSWDNGSDIVVLPEYIWANLMWYSSPYLDLSQWSDIFWEKYWPKLEKSLSRKGKMVVLGSVPARAGNKFRNRAPIIADRRIILQDKLCLTPWEAHLDGGEEINIFEFNGARIAVLICLDSEIPATADILKQNGPLDILIVPSATESLVGVERIARCSSARSVELGAAVIVSQITGGVGDDFIGDNLGQNSLYLPSLSDTADVKRIDERGVFSSGTRVDRFEVDLNLLREAAADRVNTNPALIVAQKPLSVKK